MIGVVYNKKTGEQSLVEVTGGHAAFVRLVNSHPDLVFIEWRSPNAC